MVDVVFFEFLSVHQTAVFRNLLIYSKLSKINAWYFSSYSSGFVVWFFFVLFPNAYSNILFKGFVEYF